MDALSGLPHDTLKRVWDALNCLRREELFTLVLGIERGYLVAEHLSSALIEAFGTMSVLERQVSILIVPRGGMAKLLVLVDDPASLPGCIQILCDAGVRRRAEGVARLLLERLAVPTVKPESGDA